MPLSEKKEKELEIAANKIRATIIETLLHAESGHSAGPLGMADVFSAFYFHILNHDPKNPEWEDRDRLILSNGHIVPVRYVTMAYAGYFPLKELRTLRKLNSRLQGHPHRGSLPGVETTSGPLGSGLAQACGMALSAKLDNKKHRIYCLLSDGEHQEGATWEAAMFIGKEKLSNLTGIIDRNNIQIDGKTDDVMPLEPIVKKWEAFGWHAIEIDGHDICAIREAFGEDSSGKPKIIIAHTTKGKGVSFMEDQLVWHYYIVTDDPKKKALLELRSEEDNS